MSYWTISQMALDTDLFARVSACAAQEQDEPPRTWAGDRMLNICAAPGWAEAWESALAADLPDPGRNESVITDGQILSAVQELIGVD